MNISCDGFLGKPNIRCILFSCLPLQIKYCLIYAALCHVMLGLHFLFYLIFYFCYKAKQKEYNFFKEEIKNVFRGRSMNR
jgi:hypothetical protein